MATKPPAKDGEKAKKTFQLIEIANAPKLVCDHLMGENHTDKHRITVGVIIMGLGVGVSKGFPTVEILHFFCDGIGYLIHGLGAVPIVEWMGKVIKGKNNVADCEKAQNAIEEVQEEVEAQILRQEEMIADPDEEEKVAATV